MADSFYNQSPYDNISNFESVRDGFKHMQSHLNDVETDIEVFFLVSMGNMVLLLQTGFAFLECGVVRSKNTINILIKNFLDMFINGIAFWLFGYAFAYGEGNPFIGYHLFAGYGMPQVEFASWFYQYAFAATASTIISGAVAERCDFKAYITYSFIISGFAYPVVAHWGWQDGGWLKLGDGNGHHYEDFAGSGIVHLFAGVCSFVAAAILGPRIGRFNEETGKPNDIKGHSTPLTALGGFILIFGLIAFNAGSQGHITSKLDGAVVAMIVANTIIGGSFAAVSSLIIYKLGIFGTPKQWSYLFSLNGCLTGIVSVCAGGDRIQAWGAAVMGVISAFLFFVAQATILRMKIDDPLDAAAVHATGGFVGLICTPFLVQNTGLVFGIRDPMYLAWNVVGIVSIASWAAAISIVMFGLLQVLGIFRVSAETELRGLDLTKHGELAYPIEGWQEEQYGSDFKASTISNGIVLGVHPIMAFHKKNGSGSRDPVSQTSPITTTFTKSYETFE